MPFLFGSCLDRSGLQSTSGRSAGVLSQNTLGQGSRGSREAAGQEPGWHDAETAKAQSCPESSS